MPTAVSATQSLKDAALRDHLLTDDDRKWAQKICHEHIIEVRACGRYSARLYVDGISVTFTVAETKPAEIFELLVSDDITRLDPLPAFRNLLWHTAAECILAVRRGHAEYNTKRRELKDLRKKRDT